MRTHPLLWVALLAVAGCALLDRDEGKSRQDQFRAEFASGMLCTSAPCTVKLTVDAGCVVTVDPPTLGVDTRLSDATIRWVIQPASSHQATFVRSPRHGINPKPGSVVGWRIEFSNPTRVSDAEFTWLDKNRAAGMPRKRKHDYEIEMVQDSQRCHVDPIIINDY
jgi:hypothetical protein